MKLGGALQLGSANRKPWAFIISWGVRPNVHLVCWSGKGKWAKNYLALPRFRTGDLLVSSKTRYHPSQCPHVIIKPFHLNHGIGNSKKWVKSEILIPQFCSVLDDVMIQKAFLNPQEAIAMLESTSNGLEPRFRICLEMMKMENLILFNSCSSLIPSVWTTSKWCLEWFWTKSLMSLVQVLKIGSLCDKLHFHEVLKSDF